MDRALKARPFRGTARFEIVRQLGAGGTGLVYEVLDRERGAHVALKTLHAFTPEALRRFKNEFRSLQDIQHPNLVTLYELMEADGTWFFTMELVDGTDFMRYVRPPDGPSLDPEALRRIAMIQSFDLDSAAEETLRTDESPVVVPGGIARDLHLGFDEVRLRSALRQLVLGVSALHDAGKVHRDIKPGNVLVTGDGRVVILDFGLITGPGSLETRAVGTVNYMAPEQAAALPIGPAADWYAVGVTLYRALTGVLPFAGTPEQIMQWKVDVDAPPPSTINPAVPTDLDALCSLLLRRDPERRPAEHAILERLGAVPSPAPVASDFVGRQRELAALQSALTDSRRGAAAVLVHGESGVGKSALVRRFLDGVAARGDALILAARCYERESAPYKAVDEAMDALARHLAEMPPSAVAELQPARMARIADLFASFLQIPQIGVNAAVRGARVVEPTLARSLAFGALRALLGQLAARAPLVLSVDDLQWADADSLALLAEVLAAPGAPPLLFLATVRAAPDAEASILASLHPRLGADVRSLRVTGLPLADARQLVEQLVATVGGAPATVTEQVAEEAAGHPMFIEALVRYRILHPGAAGPVRLDEALRARFASLDIAARDVLDRVCVAGRPLPQEVCAAAAGVPFGDLATPIHVLRGASLIKTGGLRRADTVEPYHDRVREAVAETLAPPERKAIHADLARALEASGSADPEQLAVHFQHGGDPARAAVYAARAADRASGALAFERAVELYRLAIELETDADALRQLRIRLGEALADCGRGHEAAEELLAAAATTDPEVAAELRAQAANQLLRSGRIAEGVSVVSDVLASVGLHIPPTRGRAVGRFILERIRMRMRGLDFVRRDESEVDPELLRRVKVCFAVYPLGLSDTLRGHPFQFRNLRWSLDAGVPARIVRALAPNMMFEATRGQRATADVERLTALAESLAAELGDPYVDGLVGTASAACEFMLGRWGSTLARSERSEQILREKCVGAAWELDSAQFYALRSLFFLGRLAEVRRKLPVALKEASDRGDLYLSTYLRTGFPAAHAWLAVDDPGSAMRSSTDGMAEWTYPGTHLQHVHALQGELSVDLYRGDIAGAEQRIAEMWPRIKAAMYLRVVVARVVLVHLRARVALAGARLGVGDRSARIAAAARDAHALTKEAESWARPLALLIDAGVAACRGDTEAAARILAEADEALVRAEMPMFAVAARRQRGLLIGGEEGAALVAAADAWLRAEDVVKPDRFADMLVPGFAPA